MRKIIAKILKLEHRRHARYKVPDSLLIVFDPNSSKGEDIIDLSQGGVSFSYIDTGDPIGDVFEVDIRAKGGFQLGRTKVEIASNTILAELVNQAAVIRRIGAKFLNLTPVQEFDLKKFLEAHSHQEDMTSA